MSDSQSITFEELQSALLDRQKAIKVNMFNKAASHWACCLAGEVGETCNIIKKLECIELYNLTPEQYSEKLKELDDELADVVIYAMLLSHRCGTNLERAIKHKFNVVSKRSGYAGRL